MNWYRVTRADGSYSWVQATSKSEASQKVRTVGELIKLVKEVDESDVPASAKGGTAEPPTTGPVIDIDYTRTTPVSELLPVTGEERFGAVEPAPIPSGPTGGYSQADIQSYNNYLEYIKARPSWPTPKGIEDWFTNRAYWDSVGDYLDAGYTIDLIEGYTEFQAYQSKYGDLQDFSPQNLGDYLQNPDQAQQQLDAWKQEAGPEGTGFTDDQIREFKAYTQYYYQYGKPGEWVPVDVGDFITNYDQAQQQLSVWQQAAEDVEKYQISPAEALRRQEEAYARTQYAAKEAFGTTPEYQPAFAQWMGGQEQFSGALQQYVEREYPSLKSEFQATQPRLTGFPTREEARAEATRREQAFQAWLPQQIPGREQEYWAQRPAERGERLYMQAPATRTLNW